MRNGTITYTAPPRTRKELRALMNRVTKRMKDMSPKEFLDSVVRAGIYTKSGKLRKEYGGSA